MIFPGRLPPDNLKTLYQAASVFLKISISEGFGLTFLEAMDAGVPVIGSNVGGIPDIIKDGENGFLVSPFDAEELANKLKILLEDEGLRDKFIQEGESTLNSFPGIICAVT